MVHFEVISTDKSCRARRGILTTAHGRVHTPAFMPVGTAGAIKGITPEQLVKTGAEIILSNTYHLMLRPGVDVVAKLGGLHGLMGWDGPILTDSGGYQIFSLSSLTKVNDDGVEFASHIDGARIYLDPEIATQIQNRLGADIIMCFDHCAHFPAEPLELRRAVERTISWAGRSKDAHGNSRQLLFGIIQGGIDVELRTYCAREILKLDLDGYAIGGLSVGEGHQDMIKTVAHTTGLLPEHLPRYLMGVGTPVDIIAAVGEGVDMFDCVLPTRNGRNGFAFTENGPVRLKNNAHISSTEPVETDCDCYCCTNFSRGAIRHFFNCGEMLGPILLSIHNLRFYQRLMMGIRKSLERGDFAEWAAHQIVKYRSKPDIGQAEADSQ